MSFSIFIPARFGSTRLPGKPLLKIGNKTLIHRVYEKCSMTEAERIVVATDDLRIAEEVESFGGQICITDKDISSGSARVAAAVDQLELSNDVVLVNVQGDEPFISPRVIEQVADGVYRNKTTVNTVCDAIDFMDSRDASVVKVVRDSSNKALYFSRSGIPWIPPDKKDLNLHKRFLKHIGVYGYTVGTLRGFVSSPPSGLEELESLEQLRFLHLGVPVMVEDAVGDCGIGVDTIEDYHEACRRCVDE